MSEKSLSILQKIKQLFADALPTSYKLADGTDVTISLLDIGGDFLIGPDPASEGTYTLMDGTSVAVDSTGKITSVTDPSEFAATEYKLSGGDIISADKLEVGGKVTKGDAPVAEADWTLEDGTTFSTDTNGIITVLVAPNADDTQASAALEAPEILTKEAVSQMISEAISASQQSFNDEAEKLKVAEVKLSKQETTITKQGETIIQMLELMTQLAEAPAGDPPVQRKSVFSGDVQLGKKGKLAGYAEAAQKLHDQTIKN